MVEIMSDEKKEEQIVEQKEETKELSTEERLEAMERAIFNMQAAITKLSELSMPAEEKPAEVPPEEPKPEEVPLKSEDVLKVEDSTLTKKDFDEFKNAIIELLKPKESDIKLKSELELALKARDEQIENMKKQLGIVETKEQIKTIETAEKNSTPQTVQDTPKEEEHLEGACPIAISNGEVTFNKFV